MHATEISKYDSPHTFTIFLHINGAINSNMIGLRAHSFLGNEELMVLR